MNQMAIMIKDDFKNYLKSAQGILFALLFALPIYYSSYKALERFQEMEAYSKVKTSRGQMDKKMIARAVQWFVGKDNKDVNVISLFEKCSPTLTFLFIYGLFLLPMGALMVFFDQCASMIGNRYIRYLLPRISREHLYISKFISAVLIFLISLFLILLPVSFYAIFKSQVGSVGDNFAYFLKIYSALAVLGLPFIAMNAMFGVMVGNSILALTISSSYYIVIGLIGSLNTLIQNKGVSYLQYLSPGIYKYKFLSTQAKDLGMAYSVPLIFTVVFFAIGFVIIQKRDL